jgi:isopenicillin N synthase-like dioxygenase
MTEVLPVIDLQVYLNDPDSKDALNECKKVSKSLRKYSALAVKDPRVSVEENSIFLDTMEEYYQQSYQEKLKDTRPEYHYQVGATPEFTESPKCNRDPKCISFVEEMEILNKPADFTGKDPKWRFFWRIGDRPKDSKFKELNADQVYPENIKDWGLKMDNWGNKMYNSVNVLSEMMAIGFDLPKDTFTKLLVNGSHLLAPTGSDLEKYGKIDTVLAGFHSDLNFLTIHGKSRYPALNIWIRDGNKVPAKIPDGCLLVQSGRQLEYLTGGFIQAGYHEVVVNSNTIAAMKKEYSLGKQNLWRVSSTLFSHVMTDNILEPLPTFHELQHTIEFPPILAGDFVQKALNEINLMSK